ncbi:MAG TPA: BlaI/MecI/CopY family transcriptional regulator [Gemmatimonadales bacterium]|nr:BlaI/MecI/CopY family transcriptional regulator [Gemmatimonadales bacterium]
MADHALTALQLALMQVLWAQGEATVQEVLKGLDRRLAQSTVATLLSRLEKKGLVTHRVAGRQYVYRAVITEPEVRQTMVQGLTMLADDLFDGDVAALVSHLLTARDVNRDDLARVKALIEARERELRGKKA